MPVKSAMEAARANENPSVDPRSPLRAALDELGQALAEADLTVGGLAMRLEPALTAESDAEKGGIRPAYPAPLLEEVHQLTDRAYGLVERLRGLGFRLVL